MRNAFVDGISILDSATMNSIVELQDFSIIFEGTKTDEKAGSGITENGLNSANIAIRVSVPENLGRIVITADKDGTGSDIAYALYEDDFDPAGTTLGTLIYSGIYPKEFINASAGKITLPMPVEGLSESNYYWLLLDQAGDATNNIDIIGESSTDANYPVYTRNGDTGAWSSSNAIHFATHEWDEVGDIIAGIEGGQVSWLRYYTDNDIFGTPGRCENYTLWTSANSTLANDASNFVEGAASIKNTILTGTVADGTATYNIYSLLSSSKYYFISGWVKHGSGAYYSWIRCTPNGTGATTKSSATVTNTSNFQNVGLVLSPSDWGSGSSQINLRLFVTGAAGNFGYFDSVKIFEITSSDAALTISELLSKYPNIPTAPIGDLIGEYSYIPAVNGDESKSIREIMTYTGSRKGVVLNA